MPPAPKLSELQLVVLAHAAKRDDRYVLPLPASLTDHQRTRTQITDLIKRKLLAEHEVSPRAPYWREEEDRRIGLVVTAAGCAAIGIDLTDGEPDQQSTEDASLPAAAHLVHTGHETASPRPASKRAGVIALLARPDGAGLAEICNQTGWLAHSARAFLTSLRKSGHRVERTRSDGVTRYAITETANAER